MNRSVVRTTRFDLCQLHGRPKARRGAPLRRFLGWHDARSTGEMLHPLGQALCTLGRRAIWVAFGASCALTFVNMRSVRSPPSTDERPRDVPRDDIAKPTEPAIPRSALVATLRPTPQTVAPSISGRRAFSLSDIGACHRATSNSEGIYASEWSVTYVTRGEVARLLEAGADSGSRAHFILGPIAGARVDGTRSDDPVRRMGFANGDVVLSVDGYDLSTPERVLAAYGHLRNAPDLTVIFLRNGTLQARLIRIC